MFRLAQLLYNQFLKMTKVVNNDANFLEKLLGMYLNDAIYYCCENHIVPCISLYDGYDSHYETKEDSRFEFCRKVCLKFDKEGKVFKTEMADANGKNFWDDEKVTLRREAFSKFEDLERTKTFRGKNVPQAVLLACYYGYSAVIVPCGYHFPKCEASLYDQTPRQHTLELNFGPPTCTGLDPPDVFLEKKNRFY